MLKAPGGNFRNVEYNKRQNTQYSSSSIKTKQFKQLSETEYFTTTPPQPPVSLTQLHQSLPSPTVNDNGNDNSDKETYNFSLVIGTITGLTLLFLIGAIIYRNKYYQRLRIFYAKFRNKNNNENNKNDNTSNYDDDYDNYDLFYHNNNNIEKEGAYSTSNNSGSHLDIKIPPTKNDDNKRNNVLQYNQTVL